MKISLRNKIEEYTLVEDLTEISSDIEQDKMIASVPEICIDLPIDIKTSDQLQDFCSNVSIELYTFLKGYFDI